MKLGTIVFRLFTFWILSHSNSLAPIMIFGTSYSPTFFPDRNDGVGCRLPEIFAMGFGGWLYFVTCGINVS